MAYFKKILYERPHMTYRYFFYTQPCQTCSMRLFNCTCISCVYPNVYIYCCISVCFKVHTHYFSLECAFFLKRKIACLTSKQQGFKILDTIGWNPRGPTLQNAYYGKCNANKMFIQLDINTVFVSLIACPNALILRYKQYGGMLFCLTIHTG